MQTMQRFTIGTVAVVILLGGGGCNGMSTQDKTTAVGAGGVGDIAESVLTGGSTGTRSTSPRSS